LSEKNRRQPPFAKKPSTTAPPPAQWAVCLEKCKHNIKIVFTIILVSQVVTATMPA